MVPKHIYAYTQLNAIAYPGYVSLSLREDCDHPMLTVRSPGENGMRVASLPLPLDRMEELAKAMLAHVAAERESKN